MRALAVIGANFGDEGKGALVDYLCAREGAGVVVRFNGGAQAGHTVVTPDGPRHVFSHFGCGSFVGVPTFLSQHFVCNPILFARELKRLPMRARVFVHPECLVTTPADMSSNQMREWQRGAKAHGSCGVGFGSTIERSEYAAKNGMPRLLMRDLWQSDRRVLRRLMDVFADIVLPPVKVAEADVEEFLDACRTMATVTEPATIRDFRSPIFEGAQGLLLDQNSEYFPHVTRSNTGIRNVRELCAEAGIDKIDAYYVSRTYLTRHGAGPLPGEDPALRYEDDTNVPHPWQGLLRFAPLDYVALYERCAADFGAQPKIVFTHCDQLAPSLAATLHSFGPHRDAFERVRKEKCA